MNCKLFWEHNGDDTLLYSTDFLGAFARGETLDAALSKMPRELVAFAAWSGQPIADEPTLEVAEQKQSELNVCDADSDAIFLCETLPLSVGEYTALKQIALKSARDFYALYNGIPDKTKSALKKRETFYGSAPRTAEEMYIHTKNVNSYYFGEVGVDCNNDGDILSCRERGFEFLEKLPNFLSNKVIVGSYDEKWSVKKMLRRFVWHDRIHAKAMYRMAIKTFGSGSVPDIFGFETLR